jgi:alanine racemase
MRDPGIVEQEGGPLQQPLIWAEIDLNAIAHNVKELRRITNSKARVMAVVKANGYGHGSVEVARTALANGAQWLGVARLHEAVVLREAGLEAPILIFGYTPPEEVATLIAYDLAQTVYSVAAAQAFSEQPASKGHKIRVHLKVDTGMGRLGFLPAALAADPSVSEDLVRQIGEIYRLPGIQIEGIFTHFATSDSADKDYALRQLDLFRQVLARLAAAGLDPPLKHAANSAAVIDLPESHLDMVRAGIAIYGLYPSHEVGTDRIRLKPAMRLKSRIIHVKRVPAGFKVSYGITYETSKPTTIATVPVGYADGLNRRLSSRGNMLVHGQRAPIVGRICMDLTMLDVGHLPDVAIGDEAVVFGHQGDAHIHVDEIAGVLDTINYEILTSISARVPRVYV